MEFVGREIELQNLHQMLQENNQVVIAAIAGMGGLGKTELALQYAKAHRETYKGGICWLTARAEDVGIQIVQFARTHLDLNLPQYLDGDLPSQVKYCWQHWREGDVLVVLDDLNDYSKVETYLPPQLPRFKVLITTRLQLDLPQSFTLNVLGESSAVEVLQAWVGEKVTQESAAAKKLCERLGYLPLALNLVGRYIKKRRISLAEMVQRLEAKGKALNHQALMLDEKDRTCTLNVKRGVIAAFELSWEELNNDAKELGVLLSLFALAPIPWTLVESVERGKDAEQLEDSRVELESLHLLQGEDSYQLHQLIREFFQLKQAEFNQVEEFKRSLCRVMVAVAKEIPEHSTLEQITDVTPVIHHLAEVANNQIQYLSDEDLTWPFIANSRFYNAQGLYAQALPFCKECVEVIKKRLGKEHPDFATSLNNLAAVYRCQGKYSEAEPLYQQALALIQHLLGEEHPVIALSLNNLAGLYNSQGRYSEAEPLYQQALALTRRLLGEEHPDFALSLNNLAILYNLQGRYTEAEPLYEQALALTQRLLGEEHPDVAQNLNNLANLYNSQGRYNKAESLYLQVLAFRLRLLGEEHPDVALSLNNLAALYKVQGKYSEAKPLYQKALALRLRLLGEEHPDTAQSLNNLAVLYRSQGQYSEAEPLCQKALKLRQSLLGEEHPDFVQSLNNLAVLYYSQEKYSEAEPLFQQALELRQRLLGEEHPDFVQSLNNLAVLYYSQEKYSEAEPLFQQALELRQRLLGEEHPDFAQSLYNLAGLYYSQGRYSKAEPLYQKALELRRGLLGDEHPNVAQSLNSLAALYHSQEKYSKAELFLIQALDIFERKLGLDHPDTITTRDNLADLRDRIPPNQE